MQRRTANLLALAALGGLAAQPGQAKDKVTDEAEVSFASPDEAIEYLANALRMGDLPAAVAAFGIERRARDYSFIKMAERLHFISLSNAVPPTRTPFYAEVAKAQFTYEATVQLRNLTYSLLAPAGTPLDTPLPFAAGDDVGQIAGNFEAALDPGRLANLQVLASAIPNPTMAASEQFRRAIAAQLVPTGGDDLEERFVLCEFEGVTYRIGLTLVRHGDRWQIRTLVANLGGSSPAGHAVPMSLEDFAAAVS